MLGTRECTGRSLQKLCDTRETESGYQWLFRSSITAYQRVNQGS